MRPTGGQAAGKSDVADLIFDNVMDMAMNDLYGLVPLQQKMDFRSILGPEVPRLVVIIKG